MSIDVISVVAHGASFGYPECARCLSVGRSLPEFAYCGVLQRVAVRVTRGGNRDLFVDVRGPLDLLMDGR